MPHEQEIASFIQKDDELITHAVANALLALRALILKDSHSVDS